MACEALVDEKFFLLRTNDEGDSIAKLAKTA